MNIEELAEVLGKHPATVRRWVRSGIIAGSYPGGLRGLGLRFVPEEVARQFRMVGMGGEAMVVQAWCMREQNSLVG